MLGPRGPALSDVTRILSALQRGGPKAADQLLPLVYDELRREAEQLIHGPGVKPQK
jgi:hypothetical protein